MRLPPAWLGSPAEIAAEVSVGVVEPLTVIAEFVSRAAAFAVIVGMFVVVAENKTGAYVGPGQDLPGGSRHHYELALHNLGTNAGFRRQGCRSVSRDVRKPVTSYWFISF